MSERFEEKIEILGVNLLDQHRPLVEDLKRLARSLGLELGWHYLLDLSWILSQLGLPLGPGISGQRIMDAGAGTGLMQWYLASQGAQVISVDRLSRASLPLRFRSRFYIQGMRTGVHGDLVPSSQLVRNYLVGKVEPPMKVSARLRDLSDAVVGGIAPGVLSRLVRRWDGARVYHGTSHPGNVVVYNQDLKELDDIPDNSLDAVVAVSALEHNTPEGLEQVVIELMRVLKPGGKLIATLCAARDRDQWHEPSSGWCYSDASLRRLFHLSPEAPSNYRCYNELFSALWECAELRDNLASFYFQSGENGMPWGKWDPHYQPVGVCKVKG